MTRPDLGCVGFALLVGHYLGDFWVQSDKDACAKGQPGAAGRIPCARHVATYTATAVLALAAARTVGVRPTAGRTVAGLLVSAVSHYVIDRRAPLRWLAERTGKARFYATPEGPLLLDQAAHIGFLYIAALIISGGPTSTRKG